MSTSAWYSAPEQLSARTTLRVLLPMRADVSDSLCHFQATFSHVPVCMRVSLCNGPPASLLVMRYC